MRCRSSLPPPQDQHTSQCVFTTHPGEYFHEVSLFPTSTPRSIYKYSGIRCAGRDQCEVRSCLRVKMAEDPRRFGPIPHGTARWAKHYARRSSVERINSRLDVSFGFERHYIRGLQKMRLRMGMAMAVMLSMALGRIREKRLDRMRSLVGVA